MLDMKITYVAILCSKTETTFCDVWHDTSGRAESY